MANLSSAVWTESSTCSENPGVQSSCWGGGGAVCVWSQPLVPVPQKSCSFVLRDVAHLTRRASKVREMVLDKWDSWVILIFLLFFLARPVIITLIFHAKFLRPIPH